MRRISVLVGLVTTLVLGTTSAAWACGSLVAANGAVQLVRTTTLAAHHDGVEHYVTNFEFASEAESLARSSRFPVSRPRSSAPATGRCNVSSSKSSPPRASTVRCSRRPAQKT